MLDIVPQRWFRWDFTIAEGARSVADLDMSCWRERGELRVEGVAWRVGRERAMSGDFLLESERGVAARATKPSAFSRRFLVRAGAKTYELRPRSTFGRTFDLFDGDRKVGSISPTNGWWSRRASADLPTEIPLPVRIFLVWLTMTMWKRDADAAASG